MATDLETRVKNLEAKAQKLRAKFENETKKERDSQLIAWGVVGEFVLETGDETDQEIFRGWCDKFLADDPKLKKRHERGLARIAAKVAPAAPSTPPE